MKAVESDIFEYLSERGWDNPRPADIAKSICIEAAELLEIFQWDSSNLQETRQDAQRMRQIEKELADVFIYALNMTVLLGFDTERIIREKIEQVKEKYPADLMRSAEPGANTAYIKIKENHRQERIS